ncbi:MAG: guanitoxin biosynthesis MBL fold metallo-hydrolase GntH, partial [Planctomycetota bacterium]
MNVKTSLWLIPAVVGAVLVAALLDLVPESSAQDFPSPVKARARAVYMPNTEDLGPDEMRIVACGTGMPNARLSQAATCFLVELGNGDKFLFDIGSGSADRISGLEIPYDYLDKVFISHLHSDHFGDLPVLYIGGWVAGRVNPLRVWGPSGTEPHLGTKAAVEGMKKMLAWDLTNRRGRLPTTGGDIQVTEFDYMGMNHVVFQENGVTIRAWPAIHGLDGSVSYALYWKGLKFVFGGDTYPNKWFIEYAKDADAAIHE